LILVYRMIRAQQSRQRSLYLQAFVLLCDNCAGLIFYLGEVRVYPKDTLLLHKPSRSESTSSAVLVKSQRPQKSQRLARGHRLRHLSFAAVYSNSFQLPLVRLVRTSVLTQSVVKSCSIIMELQKHIDNDHWACTNAYIYLFWCDMICVSTSRLQQFTIEECRCNFSVRGAVRRASSRSRAHASITVLRGRATNVAAN